MLDEPEGATIQAPGRAKTPITTWAFRATLALFLAASTALAWCNRSPGSADSCANLTLARNIAQGRGFVTFGVGQLWEPQPIPSPETIKPPGLAYLTATLFAVFGPSLGVPVLINAVTVASNALLLRIALTRTSGGRIGDVGGLLALLSRNQEMVSLWNNNILTACHSALLMIAAVGRGGPGTAIALGFVSAFGFLMKPTFLLGAVPFAILILGWTPGRPRRDRVAMILGFLTLFVALTSPYWLTNLLRHGDPFYSPGFTSGRLAVRYDVLGTDTWTTVRFGQPMTYTEVARTLGVPAMLLADARMIATTIYYSVALNPAVAILAGIGFLLFRRNDRWRDYTGPIWLAAAIEFEVGIYNHHEARYLWPVYPCLLYLAALSVRDFSTCGLPRMMSDLASRFRVAFLMGVTAALVFGGFMTAATWRDFIREARCPIPPWVTAVSRLPADAVILVGETPSVGWWTGHPTVICPTGPRDGLEKVISLYHADHYLATGADGQPSPNIPFHPDELSLIDRGDRWGLYHIASGKRTRLLEP